MNRNQEEPTVRVIIVREPPETKSEKDANESGHFLGRLFGTTDSEHDVKEQQRIDKGFSDQNDS